MTEVARKSFAAARIGSAIFQEKKIIFRLVFGLLTIFIIAFIYQIISGSNYNFYSLGNQLLSREFLIYFLVGLIAQVIDGALGMAYGVSSTSFLITAGVSPAAASAGVHIAEVFTSGVSGLSHLKVGNVNRKLFFSLLIPGVIGAIIGATVLSNFDGNSIKPFIAVYLFIMGIIILKKALKSKGKKAKSRRIAPLALIGGFLDSVGGGGWGPVVSSTLISKGREPKYTIGSVNLAEFFIAFASAGTFMLFLGGTSWVIIAGLITGGLFAAPFAGILVKRVKTKYLMVTVGVLIIFLSSRTIWTTINDLFKLI